MAFVQRSFPSDPLSSFAPLFRLLDDFDTYNRGSGTMNMLGSMDMSSGPLNMNMQQRQQMRPFNPRFDVKELPDCYEMHGEFPGMDQKDIEIDFMDAQTITIRGCCDRVSDSSMMQENTRKSGFMTGNGTQYHQTTMEEDNSRGTMTGNKTSDKSMTQSQSRMQTEKYLVCERACGDFSRSFSFPTRVDQDAVKASMKNGILTIQVPKTKKHDSRKIVIY